MSTWQKCQKVKRHRQSRENIYHTNDRGLISYIYMKFHQRWEVIYLLYFRMKNNKQWKNRQSTCLDSSQE